MATLVAEQRMSDGGKSKKIVLSADVKAAIASSSKQQMRKASQWKSTAPPAPVKKAADATKKPPMSPSKVDAKSSAAPRDTHTPPADAARKGAATQADESRSDVAKNPLSDNDKGASEVADKGAEEGVDEGADEGGVGGTNDDEGARKVADVGADESDESDDDGGDTSREDMGARTQALLQRAEQRLRAEKSSARTRQLLEKAEERLVREKERACEMAEGELRQVLLDAGTSRSALKACLKRAEAAQVPEALLSQARERLSQWKRAVEGGATEVSS